jgi:NitT/TauT family transport system substrate-binding protein
VRISSFMQASAFIAAITIQAAGASAQDKITIGATPIAEPATAMVALEEGFFRKHGIDVTYTLITINPSIPPALLAGSLQIGVPTPTTFLQAVDGGLDLVIVAGVSNMSRTSSRISVLVRKDSSIKEPKDLVGKKFGVPGLNAVLHVVARYWLMQHGVEPKSVNFVEAVFPAHGDMLRSGNVDAVITAEPFLGNILNRGDGTTLANISDEFPIGNPTMMYVTTRDYAKKNPSVITGFKASLEEAKAFIASNPDRTREDVGKTLKLPAATLATLAIPTVDTKVTSAQLAFWIDVMKKQNMVSREIDPEKLILN